MTGTLEGGCACGAVRYRLASAPMFVNCCHCTWCQRETGSAFVINAIIETWRLTRGAVEPLRRAHRVGVRASWNVGPAAFDQAGRPHLHPLQATLGEPRGRRAGVRDLLRAGDHVAAGEPRAARSDAGRGLDRD